MKTHTKWTLRLALLLLAVAGLNTRAATGEIWIYTEAADGSFDFRKLDDPGFDGYLAWDDTTSTVDWVDSSGLGGGGANVQDDVYGSGWNGDTTNAPSQNAVYDKINAMDSTIAANTAKTGVTTQDNVASGTVTPRTGDIDFSGGSDGNVLTVQADGSIAPEAQAGGGDMSASTYDPNTVSGDAFDMDNMVEGADAKIMTAAERSAIAANTAKTTNATHTGDVTGSGALTIATGAVQDDEIDYTAVTLNDFTFDVGSVSKTEFGYVDGVTGAIQAQLDLKAALLHGVVAISGDVVDTTEERVQTITISDELTDLTFDATPPTGSSFYVMVYNSDTTDNPIGFPSANSPGYNGARTEVTVPTSGWQFLTFWYDGTNYYLFGDQTFTVDLTVDTTPTNSSVDLVAYTDVATGELKVMPIDDFLALGSGAPGADSVGTSQLDDDANTPVAGYAVVVETGAASFDYVDLSGVYQPLESTLTDIADGTITENLVNTANPWADNEVSDTLTASLFVGSGSSSTAVDLATAEVSGTLTVGKGGTGVGTSGTTSQIAVGGGTGSPIVWTTATGTGAPVRATSPTLVTPAIGAASATTPSANDNDTSVATTAFVQTAKLTAVNTKSGAYTIGTDSADELRGGFIAVTAAATMTGPATLVAGESFTIKANTTGTVVFNPDNAHTITLDGVALSAGDSVSSTGTAGELITFIATSTTTLDASSDGWTDTN